MDYHTVVEAMIKQVEQAQVEELKDKEDGC